MKLIWSKDIVEWDNYPNTSCKPIIWNGKLLYAYKASYCDTTNKMGRLGNKITLWEMDINNGSTKSRSISFGYDDDHIEGQFFSIIWQSDFWKFIIKGKKLFLDIGIILDLNKSKIIVADNNPRPREVSWIKESYEFGDKIIKYNQRFIFECFNKKSNKRLWKLVVKGFLYTKSIDLKNDCLIFGTAGKGGALYCVNINSGKIVMQYMNRGCVEIAWQKNTVLVRGIKADLVQIDPFTGEMLNTLKITNKKFGYPMLVKGNLIFTTLYENEGQNMSVVCIKN